MQKEENKLCSALLVDFAGNLDMLRGELSPLNTLEESPYAEAAAARLLEEIGKLNKTLALLAAEFADTALHAELVKLKAINPNKSI